ncbi:PAS domain S-box protein [Nostoc sp. LEGE 12447]|uniref:PAS domain-containing hybrid sensor histidine kinase/response regulator n=1 Tax=Nostoc sp. LEGE 12447 TaxID=1828640 RepID=UPI0018848EAC|nr:PAS domain-containing sensor histidine kinase [Nostoc sp. LEGE 12447]MBE9002306.1 PAS domain S-box protein [Nostoc sp. LEGE 12447]
MESEENSISSEQIELINKVLAASTDHIYISDRQQRYLYASPAALAALGLQQDQLLGKTWQELGFPVDIMEVYDAQRKWVFQMGKSLRSEMSFPTVNGIRYYEYVVAPIWGNDGEIGAVINTGRDITERKQAQEALRLLTEELEARVAARTQELTDLNQSLRLEIAQRQQAQQALEESEMRFQTLVDAMFEGIVIQEQGKIIDANPGFARMLGYTLEEVIGKSAVDFLTPESLATFVHHIENEYELPYEITGKKKDGSLISLEVVGKQSIYQGRSVRVSAARDITERKQAQEKIHEQAALIDVSTDAIFVCDLKKHILFWNQGAENLYGWTADENSGKKADEIFYRERLSQLDLGLAATIEHGFWQGELKQFTKTGKEIIVASRWTLVQNQFGQTQSILIVNTDITEKKQLEQQFLRAQRLESIGTLASGIAHDLNNLLSPILMSLELLEKKFSDPQTQPLLKMLYTNVQRGADLIKQVLSFAKGVSSKRIIFQLKHIVAEIQYIIQQTFPKSIEFTTEFPLDLWSVYADPTQLQQVLMNLCINARDAMPYGGSLKISAANQFIDEFSAQKYFEAKVGYYVTVSVIDTGIGIAPEVLERIFEPFFTTKEIGKGTGLGLSTVMGIVKTYGGFINVESSVGQGSRFQIYFPAFTDTQQQQPLTEDYELLKGNGEVVLVVDDELSLQQIIQTSLLNYNYQMLSANNGVEAISVYVEHKNKISAALIDLMMPDMDGIITICTLQKINPHLKIIAMSGLATNEKIAEATSAGIKAFLPKPFTLSELLRTLSLLLNQD